MKRMSRRMKRMIALLVVEVLVAVNVLTAYANDPGIDTYTLEQVEEMAQEQEDEPVVEETVVEEPVVEETTEEPVVEEPVVEPIVEETVVEEPTEVPVVEEPTEAPVVEEPTEVPVVEEPTEAPAAADAVTEEQPTESPEVEESPVPSASIKPDTSAKPDVTPTAVPSTSPSVLPSVSPSALPSASPTATPSATPTATPSATPTAEVIIEENNFVITGICVAGESEIAEAFTISVSDACDVNAQAPEIEGYTYTDVATLADGSQITEIKAETVENETEDGIVVTTVMSYFADGTWVEITEDITVTYEYVAEKEDNEVVVNFSAVCVDQDGNVIEGYEETALFLNDTLDLTTEQIAIEGYEYQNAMIDDQVVLSLDKNIEIDENSEEVVSYSYTTETGTTEVTDDTTVTFVYEVIVKEVVITFDCIDDEGNGLVEAAAKPEFETELALVDVEADPIEIEGYLYKEAKVADTVITALTKTVDEKTGAASYAYVTEAGETVAVEEDTVITLVYEKEAVVVVVNATCVDEFGDPISDKYTEIKLPDFANDMLVLNDAENPPVKDIWVWKSLVKVVKYTYVKASIGSEIITGLKREVTKDTAELKDKEKEYIYSYTTDGTTWTKIQEDTTIKFGYTGGSKTTYTYEDANVSVVATLQHADAIPDGAEFKVTPVTASTSGYNYDAYLEALNNNADQIADENAQFTEQNTLMYDIAFLAPEIDAEGNVVEGSMVEYQPAEGMVSISFTFKQSQLSEELASTEAADVTVVHLPLEDSVKESTATTADATDITASDVKVEVVDATISFNGSTDQVDFCATEFSMYVWVNPWTGDRTYYPGTSVTYNSILGSAVNYGIVASEIAHSAHMDTNFATALLSGSAQTTAGEYTGNNNPGDFIIAEYTGNNWYTNCKNATKPFVIYTTKDAKAKFSQSIYDNQQLVIDTNSSKEELTAQVNALIAGVDSSLVSQEGYTPSQIMEYTQREWGIPDQKYLIDLTHSGAGTYYVNFSEGEFSTYFDQASRVYIKMYEDQNIVFNIPDTTVNLSKFEISMTSRPDNWPYNYPSMPSFVGSDVNNASADQYAQKFIFNMPNATFVTAQSSIVGVVLCPNADFHIGSTSTGWLVAKKVTNGGEWHGVWQDMPDSVYVPADTNLKASKTVNGETPAETFTFKLEELKDGSWATVETKQNNGSEVDFSDISYEKEGTYYYRISEVKGNGDYQYDTTMYVAKVVVTSDSKTVGSLTTTTYSVDSTTYYKGSEQTDAVDGNAASGAAFNNIKIDKGAIAVTKAVVGHTTDKTFYFVVKDSAGNQIGNVCTIKNGETVTIEELLLGDYTVVETDKDGNTVVFDSEGFPYTVNAITQNVTVAAGATSNVTITNTYGAEGSMPLSAAKTLNGKAPEAGKFSFELKDAAGNVLQTRSNDAGGNVTFKAIEYTLADAGKTFTYTISEVIPEGAVNNVYNGTTYDATVYTVTVTPVDNGDGTITAAPSYSTASGSATVATFANTYDANGKVDFEATKTLNGKTLEAGQFSFVITDEAGTVVSKGTNAADGSIDFSEITYGLADVGEYTYTISEVIPSDAAGNVSKGCTYDDTKYTVKVTVVDDGDGTLEVTKDVEDKIFTFTNEYNAKGELTLFAEKTLNGVTPEDGQFTFTLTGEGQNQLKTNDGNGKVYFDKISYTEDDLAQGTFVYTVSEKADGVKGYDYDESVYTVTVVLNDKDGVITPSVTYQKTADGETVTADGMAFANTYKANGEVVLQATKTLNGKTPADKQFSFVLKDADGKEIETVQNDGSGNITFSPITYTDKQASKEGKTYIYTITEKVTEKVTGYTYDESVTNVTVKVTDDGKGNIITEASYAGNKGAFSNTYESTGSVTLNATKNLTGKTLADAEQFSFVLKDAEGNVIETVNNKTNGEISFAPISYTQADVANSPFTYTVNEVIPAGADEDNKLNGYTYDETLYTVTVSLVDDGKGNISTEKTYKKTVDETTSDTTGIVFNNEYTASGEVVLKADKTLTGRVLEAGQFEFALLDATQETVLKTAKNDASGVVTFEKLTYDQKDAGLTYTYYIKEVIPEEKAAGYTYDDKTVKVTVVVTDNGNGSLEAKETYEGVTASFENFYNAAGKVELEAQKNLTGRDLEAGQFCFELRDASKNLLQTKTNDADGKVAFDKITYTQADLNNKTTETVVYYVSEVYKDVEGYTYDTSEYKVTVTLKDNGNGTITATPAFSKNGEEVGAIGFNNTYKAEGQVVIEANKELKGRALEADQFSFVLKDADGKEIETVSNLEGGAIMFSPIQYKEKDAGKTFTYTINEVKGTAAGYTYDTVVRTVEVTVADDGNGKLTATPKFTEGNSTFTNYYEATGKLELTAKKTLTGRTLTAGQFEFQLLDASDNVIETVANDADGNVKFTAIQYTEDNIGTTFTYKVKEVYKDAAGYTYDQSVYTVTVTLADDGKGNITATPSYSKATADGTEEVTAISFANTYEAKGSVDLEADKTLSGRDLTSGQFSFQLKEGNKVLQTITNDAEGKVKFNTINYTQADAGKTFNYTISEVNDGKAGYTYDDAVKKVTVTVTDNGDGTLAVNKVYADGTASFTNSYKADGAITFSATKTLTGSTLVDEQFEFQLKEGDSVLQTKTNDANGNVAFDQITYTQADLAKSPIAYTVSEVNAGAAGYTYDGTVYTITVTLTDNGDGTIEATKVINNGSTDVDSMSFANTYKADGEVILEANKTLEGRTLEDGQFEFQLKEGNTVLQTKANTGSTVIFDAIKYDIEDAGKTFTYTISEVIPEGVDANKKLDGYTYDSTVRTVTVAVTDNGNATLTTTATYDNGGSAAQFSNTYKASGSVTLEAKKTLTGRDMEEGQFSFTLTGNGVSQTKTNDAGGAVKFDEISYTEANLKNSPISYTVQEVLETKDGYTYDETVYTVKVTLTDNGNGTILAVPSYEKNGASTEELAFTNTYAAKGNVQLKADKTLKGKALADKQFSFELKDAEGNVLQTKTNDASGAVVFDAISYTTADIGATYTYTISEVNDGKDGYAYDESIKTVTVAITDNGNGSLTAIPTYDGGAASFVNTYSAKGSVTLDATKVLKGRTLEADQFSFELKDASGNVLQTKKNAADGKVAFDTINYTEADLAKSPITYSVSEVLETKDGYKYDNSVYTVTVTLTDNGDGTIKAEPVITKDNKAAEGMVFTNTYTAAGEVILEATKTLDGRTLADQQFKFELKDEKGTVLQTKYNNASGAITFDKIIYAEGDAGKEFKYTISEVAENAAGYTYDTTVYEVVVKVTDSGNGKLEAKATYTNGPAKFENTYVAAGNVTLGATKTLTGRTLEADQFSFELKDASGKVLQTKKNAADGSVSFDTISYTEDDIKNSPIKYTVNEVVETKEGYKYDNSVYTVEVALKDNGDGTLAATPTYKKGETAADSMVFANTYTAEGEIVLTATKALEGRTLADGQFKFELKDIDGKVLQTKTNTAGGTVTFDKITYTTEDAGQKFKYTISEVVENEAGYTYDETVYEVIISVTDDGNGSLTATADYTKGNAEFKNTYKAEGSVVLDAKKTLTGRTLAADQFEFVLADAAGNKLQTAKNAADGSITFETIKYTEADLSKSPITYKISEVNAGADGYTYEADVYEVVVTLIDNGDGTITAEKNKTGEELTFVNSYAAEGEVNLVAKKALDGRKLAADQFSFELKDAEGKVLQTKKSDGSGNVTFDTIKYSEADAGKEFMYTISEVKGTDAGYTYDATVYNVTVTVIDSGDGTLKAEAEYVNGNADFKNTYKAEGSVVLEAKKTLAGRTLAADQFEFVLKDAAGNTLDTAKNAADGKVIFAAINYTEADLANSPFTYTVSEANAGADGYTYATDVYTVTVTLTDNGDGTITATKDKTAEELTFANTYTAEGSVILKAKKTLEGRTLADGQFEFQLKDEAGTVLQTKKSDGSGNITFDVITYDQDDAGKEFNYTISEVNAKADGYTYDATVYNVKVTVTDEGNGKLTATETYVDGEANFKNTYEAEGTVVLDAKKTLTGRKLAADQFSFELKDAAGNVLQTKTNTAEGIITFDAIAYDQDDIGKEFKYTISEVNAGDAGYTYEADVYTVTVTLTDNGDGTITATKSCNSGEDLTFANTYAAEGEVILTAKKALEGRTLADAQFSFELKDAEGNVLQTKTNDGSGNITFDKIVYDQDDAGKTFNYTISEVNAGDAGYTYDATVYNVTVTVTDSGDGTLKAKATYVDGAAEFKNIYKAEGSVNFEATKELKGRALAADQFIFELKDAAGNVIQTKTNAADGSITFDAISYDQDDIGTDFTYTVSEVNAGAEGYTYEADVYTVTVTLTDNGDGTITATKSYDGLDALKFVNIYTAEGEIVLTAKKALEGRTLADQQFTFELKDAEGTVLQTVTNDVSGNITFDKIAYSEADAGKTFNYTISEVKAGDAGYTYDETVYNVTVTVTDEGNGKLTAVAEYTNGSAEFKNIYEAKGSVVLEAMKVLEDRELEAGQFEFELKDASGTVLQTKKNFTNGSVTFDVINFTQDDLKKEMPLVYTINELIPAEKAEGYTYDTRSFTVEVTLEDNGDGTITATPVYVNVEEGTVPTFTNIYNADGEITLKAEKTLVGRKLEDKQFTFRLLDEDGKVLDTKKNDETGLVTFEALKYKAKDAGKTFEYTIVEVAGNDKGYTYDVTEHKVTVTVEDAGDGTLVVTAAYDEGEAASFTNTYKADGSITLEAKKVLENADLADGQFSFELKDAAGNVLQTKTNAKNGTVAFDAITFTESDVAKNMPLIYTINEVVESKAGYTYDVGVYTVEVTLTDKGNGKIEAEAVYLKNGSAAEAVFTNVYSAAGEAVLVASKTLQGKELKDKQFSFELKDANGNVLQTKTNDGTGLVVFDAIHYRTGDAGKTFTYTINEVLGSEQGYTYDTAVHTVYVDVADNGNGVLQATISYEGGAASFVNTFTPEQPTPTPTPDMPDEPAPTPDTYQPTPTPDEPEPIVPQRVEEEGQVLGARRGTDRAVLGKRRRPATGNSMALILWVMALAASVGTALTSVVMLGHDKKRHN